MFYNPIEGKTLSREVYQAIAQNNPNLKNLKEGVSYNEAREILSKGRVKKETRHIFFGSNKGGVGKSMTALQFAWFLNARGYNVLLADLDAQANITSPLLEDNSLTESNKSLYDVILEDCGFDEIISEITQGFDLMGANHNLSEIDFILRSQESKSSQKSYFERDKRETNGNNEIYQQMYNVFKKLGEKYDYVIYDSNPETNRFNRLSMQICDCAIIPLQAKEASAKAYSVTLSEINDSFITIDRDASNIQDRVKLLFNNKESIPESRKEDIISKIYKYFSGNILNEYIDFSYELGEASDAGFPAFGSSSVPLNVIENISKVLDEVIDIIDNLSNSKSSSKKRHLFFDQA